MSGGLSFSLVFYFLVYRLWDAPLHRAMKCFFWRAAGGGGNCRCYFARHCGGFFSATTFCKCAGLYCNGNKCCTHTWADIRRYQEGNSRLTCELLFYALCAFGLILQVCCHLPETASGSQKPMAAFVKSYFALCRLALFLAYSIVMACEIGDILRLSQEFR